MRNQYSLLPELLILFYCRAEFTETLRRCEYFDFDYKHFENISYDEALELKKKSGLQKIKTCYGGDILLSDHSSRYHSVVRKLFSSKNYMIMDIPLILQLIISESSITKPINKKDERKDLRNYLGISMPNAFMELFNKIILLIKDNRTNEEQ